MKKKKRYWSCEYWSKNDISDVLKEVIEPEGVDVSSIKMHDELNPLIWDENNNMKPEVRKVLLKNAIRFIEFCSIEDLDFNDIILTGSMANYNYTDYSDIDIHVILDFAQISENKEFIGDFFRLKKALWGDRLPVEIKGHDIEMYIQDVEQLLHFSTGTYSLAKDEWINKPIKQIVNIDTADVQLKAAQYMNLIDDLENIKDSDVFVKKHKMVKDRLRKMRQSGIQREGEYSSENLAFKILRNSGYLEKLSEMKRNHLTRELSLEGINFNL